MSTVAVASAPVAAVGFGPVLLAVGVVGLTLAGITALHGYSQQKQARQALLDAAVRKAERVLRDEIAQVRNAQERARLSAELDSLLGPFQAALAQGQDTSAARLLNGLRQQLAAVHSEEQLLTKEQEALSRILDQVRHKAQERIPAGLTAKVESLLREADRKDLPLDEELRHLAALKLQAQQLVRFSVMAVRQEEPVFVAPQVRDRQVAGLVAEICDYAERIAFFDEQEAAVLRPLAEEARQGADRFRLELIREQVKTAYGRLKEQATLTALFRQDLREFLPFLRKATGPEAKKLCLRMEALLTEAVLPRTVYERAYEAARTIFCEQMDRIADAVLAKRIGTGLADLGYELLDEMGQPAQLVAGTVQTLNAPYAGYRVRVKVDGGGGLAARLIRVVGSTEEQGQISEYQRQRDVEVGKKWCADLAKLYQSLEDAGIPLHDRLRREPGEEALEVVVESGRARNAADQKADLEQAQEVRS